MRLSHWIRSGRWWAALALMAVASLMTGCSLQAIGGASLPETVTEAVNVIAAPEAITPAAPVTSNKSAPPLDMRLLQDELEAYLLEQDGTYGLYVIDLKTGASLGINADEVFPAASTWKLPTVMYVLDQVAAGKASLEEPLTFTEEDWWAGTGILQGSVPGDQYPLGYLVEVAITHSDNIAWLMLERRFGVENIEAYAGRLGAQPVWYEDRVFTTPRDMARLMRLAQGRALRQAGDLQRFLLEALANTLFQDRVAAGVPEGVTVAHKIGTLPGTVNDVALVDLPEGRFVIAAYSKDIWSEEAAANVIAEVTRKVYQFLSDI